MSTYFLDCASTLKCHFLCLISKKRMRCDAAQPTCSQCQRARYPKPCVYVTPTASTTLLQRRANEIEEEITHLQSRKHNRSAESHDPSGTDSSSSAAGSLHHEIMTKDFIASGDAPTSSMPPADWIDGEPPKVMKQFLSVSL